MNECGRRDDGIAQGQRLLLAEPDGFQSHSLQKREDLQSREKSLQSGVFARR
jgi:hypothetical protein